jgi:diguanylate cyclase
VTPHKSPSVIAREALRQLTARKLPPTPLNYQECYNEIAGISNPSIFPDAHLRQIALALNARNPAQQEQLDLLDAAIGKGSWQGVEMALIAFHKAGAWRPPAPPIWRPRTPRTRLTATSCANWRK